MKGIVAKRIVRYCQRKNRRWTKDLPFAAASREASPCSLLKRAVVSVQAINAVGNQLGLCNASGDNSPTSIPYNAREKL